MVFRSYSSYLKEKYGTPVYRVGVDAGFTCPHRAAGGCTYCDAHGARAVYLRNSRNPGLAGRNLQDRFRFIRKQVEEGMAFLRRRYDSREFILYFQANTNTFGTLEELKLVYDYALSLASFRQLVVSTRPDCLGPPVVDLLRSYRTPDREVWVELGLQSGNDTTLERLNRGHRVRDFREAHDRLTRAGVETIVHLILGLPGEGRGEKEKTVRLLQDVSPRGIKFHNLHIPAGTALYEEYLRGGVAVSSLNRHRDELIFFLERIPPDTVIMRLSTDTPGGAPAPRRFGDKNVLYQTLETEMIRRGTWQGRLF